jgi:hypothetical protein
MRRGYKWIAKEIERLDPEHDYERIVALSATYYQTDLVFNLLYTVGVMHFILPPWGGETLAAAGARRSGDGKILTRRRQRADDTLSHFWKWFEEGPSSPEVRRSVEHVNRLHLGHAKQLPGNWSHNDDFLYTLIWTGIDAHRLRLWLGLPGFTENQKVASQRFWRDMAALFRSENGPIIGFPGNFDGMLRLLEGYEAHPWESVPEGHQVCEALIEQFCRRWFPVRLQGVGRQFILSVLKDRVRQVHQLDDPHPLARRAVRLGLKTVIFTQERILPDPHRSTPERARRKRRLDPMHVAPPMVKESVPVS